MSKIKRKGGFFITGKYHKDGGIPMTVVESGQNVEIEKDEALIPSEAMDNKKIKKRTGKNIDILHQINKEVGAKGMNEDVDEVHVGDAIVCRRSIYDKKKRTYIGTDKQTVSAINVSNGCNVIEKGGKAIEPDGSITQYKKGGGVSEINSRWDKKKKHIEELANNISSLKNNLTRSLKSQNEKEFLTALIICMLMKTSERVGNEVSGDNGHHGLTNFKKKHIKINGNEVTLDYVGKSGVEHEKIFTDQVLAKYLKQALKNSKSNYIFATSEGKRVKSQRVNRYLSEFNVTAKDIRGYNANSLIIDRLKKVDIPSTEKERKTTFNKIAKVVAGKIGHGVPTLKKHYMMPELADNYIYDAEIINVKEASQFASGGELGMESLKRTLQGKVKEVGSEQRVTAKDLSQVIGRPLHWWNDDVVYVGGMKLKRCFMDSNNYKLI